jgi:hypothetical protein
MIIKYRRKRPLLSYTDFIYALILALLIVLTVAGVLKYV